MPKTRSTIQISQSPPKTTRFVEGPDAFGSRLEHSLSKHLLLAALLFLLYFLRKPDTLLVPQFYAEDICIFFRDQYRLGIGSLIETYGGYLVTIPRLVALAAAPLPVVHQPLLYNLMMLLIQSAAAATFYHPAYRWLVRSDALRLAMCLVTVLAFPSLEMIGTISNVQWPLLPVALLFLFHQPSEQDKWNRFLAIRVCLVLLIGLSAPVLAIALPLSLWRCFRARAKDRLVPLVFTATSCAQVVMYTLSHSPDTAFRVGTPIQQVAFGSAVSVLYRVVLSDVLGEPVARAINSNASHAVILLLMTAIALWLAWLIIALPIRRLQILSLIYLSLASIVTTLVGRDLIGWFQSLNRIGLFSAERYFYLSSCILVLLAGFTVEKIFNARQELAKATLLVVMFCGGIYGNFVVPPFPDLGWHVNAGRIEDVILRARDRTSAESLNLPVNPVPRYCMVP